MKNPPLILGSSSPARKELLSRLKIPFTVAIPDVDETPLPNETAEALVLRLGEVKAKRVAETHSDSLIIGCDQVGVLEGVILGKPLTFETAVKQLQFKSGKVVRFYTSLCLYDARYHTQQIAVETYDVYIRQLTDTMIYDYLNKEKPFNCAGSLQVEGLGITLIDKLIGDDYTSLIGLPLIRLAKMFDAINYNYLKE